MEWKDVSQIVGKAAPILGNLLAGQTGGISTIVGSMISSALGVANSPGAVETALKENPEAAIMLAKVEAEQRIKLQELSVTAANNALVADTQRILAVNATMQSEANSEHWPTYSWRPFSGFVFPSLIVAVYFILPLCGKSVPAIPETVWITFATILGVASWYRGRMQAEPAKQTTKG